MNLNAYYMTYKCLDGIYRGGAYSGIELNKYLRNSEDKDKPLITKLVYGVLDRDIELEYIISHFADRVKPSVMPVLKIGVYALKYLSIPEYAVVNECVNLIKDIGKRQLSGFVNATLKRISVSLKDLPLPTDKIQMLSVKYSFPEWVINRLLKSYSYDDVIAYLSFVPDHKYTHVRTNPSFITNEGFEKLLKDKAIDSKPTIEGAYNLVLDGRLNKNSYIIQSLGSMLVCEALKPNSRARVLDVCASPGGKSVYLSQKFSCNVTACDIYPHRIELIKSYAKKVNCNVDVVEKDATTERADFIQAFDYVLCDVPCSGFGVVHSKPDIKLKKTEESIKELPALQAAIIKESAKYVKKGGILVYSTCTIFHEENLDIVTGLLDGGGFRFDAIDCPNIAEQSILPGTEGGAVQLMPFRDGDGFFISRLRKL